MSPERVVVITGASAGIGAAAARRFARGGYGVVLAARRAERLHALAAEIEAAGGQALAVPTDITRWEQVQHLAQRTLATWGRVDVLVNNAGLGRLMPLDEQDPHDDILRQVQVNLTGALWVTRAFLPAMKRQGQGVIALVSSVAGWVGLPHYTVYAATKFGMRGMAEALRREIAPYGLQVVALYPGPVETEFGQHAFKRPEDRPPEVPGVKALSAEAVAADLWRLVHRPRRGRVVPGWMVPLVWLNTHLPWLSDWLVIRAFRGRGRAAE